MGGAGLCLCLLCSLQCSLRVGFVKPPEFILHLNIKTTQYIPYRPTSTMGEQYTGIT